MTLETERTATHARSPWHGKFYNARLWLILAGCVLAWAVVLPTQVDRLSGDVRVSDHTLPLFDWGPTTLALLVLAAPVLVLLQLLVITSLGYFISLFLCPELSYVDLWEGIKTASLLVLVEAALDFIWFLSTGEVGLQMHFGVLVPWGRAINPLEGLLMIWGFAIAARRARLQQPGQVRLAAALTWGLWILLKHAVVGG